MTPDPGPEGARTYRAPSGLVLLVLSGLLALFLLGDAVVRAGWGQMLLLAPWVLLGVWIVYEIAYVSSVRVDGEGAVVQNMLRRTAFGWSRVRDIDMRWQLEFSLGDESKVVAYGGPTRSRPPRARTSGDEPVRVPPGVRLLTDIRDRWEAAPGADAPIRRSWDIRALIALGVIAAWAAASVLLTGGA